MLKLIFYGFIGYFLVFYCLIPLLKLLAIKFKHGNQCSISFFPVIGGVFYGLL